MRARRAVERGRGDLGQASLRLRGGVRQGSQWVARMVQVAGATARPRVEPWGLGGIFFGISRAASAHGHAQAVYIYRKAARGHTRRQIRAEIRILCMDATHIRRTLSTHGPHLMGSTPRVVAVRI